MFSPTRAEIEALESAILDLKDIYRRSMGLHKQKGPAQIAELSSLLHKIRANADQT